MIIAFIGPDGSGKSTYTDYLHKILKKNGIKTNIRLPFNYFLLRKIINLLKKKQYSKHEFNKVTYNKNPILKLFPLIALVDNWIDYVYNLKRSKYNTICDRYYYDIATSLSEFGYSTNILYKIYIHLIPKPTVCILLIAPPKNLKLREISDKHNMKFFKNQVARYKNLPKNIITLYIDTSKNDEKKCKKILRDYFFSNTNCTLVCQLPNSK